MDERIEQLKSLVAHQELLVENNAKHLKNLKRTLRSLRKSLALAEEN